jgi:hypothetical protein
VAEAKAHEEDLVVADIDLSATLAARGQIHMFNTRNPDLYTATVEKNPYP